MSFLSSTTAFLLAWCSTGVLGLLLICDGMFSTLTTPPHGQASSYLYNPSTAFGLLLAGTLLFLLALPPLFAHFRSSSIKRPSPSTLPPLPFPFAEVAARAAEGEEGRDDSHGALPPLSLDDAIDALQVDVVHGLYSIVARERLYQCGPNEVSPPDAPSYLHTFLDELYDGPQLLLMAVGVAYALLGSMEEACTALVVVLLMVNAEVVTDFRAKRAMARLQSTVREGWREGREGRREKKNRTCSFFFLFFLFFFSFPFSFVHQAHKVSYSFFCLGCCPPSHRSLKLPLSFGTRAKRWRFPPPLSCLATSSF